MYRATLIHSFAVYVMLLTFDFGLSSQKYAYANELFKLDIQEKGAKESENQQEITTKNHNHPFNPSKDLKNNTNHYHDTETTHSILARLARGLEKTPIGAEPKDGENHIENHSSKIARITLRRVEVDGDKDEDANEDSDEEAKSEDDDHEDEEYEYNDEDHKNLEKDPDEESDDKEANVGDDLTNGNSEENPDANDNSSTMGSFTTDENSSPDGDTTFEGNSTTTESFTPNENSDTNRTVPEEWDWRKHGFLTEVGNQLKGDFCWAFAASGAVEGYNFIKTKQLETLSMQQLIDCDKVIEPEGRNFTGGHSVESALKYVKNYGIESNKTYPFTGKEGPECRYDADKVVTKINNFNRMNNTDENEMKQMIVTYGPLVVVINAGDLVRNANAYHGGIYEGCNNDDTAPHAVVAVGYGTDNGNDYWLLKNSWGSTWGEEGYFRLPRNINACGITQDVLYVE